MVWVARPNMVDAAFASWVWPLLGIVFLPFATLMYVILWQVGGSEDGTGSGWSWRGCRTSATGVLEPRVDAACPASRPSHGGNPPE